MERPVNRVGKVALLASLLGIDPLLGIDEVLWQAILWIAKRQGK